MKTITTTILMTALCCATAFAAPDLREKDLRGSIESVETAQFVGSTMFVDGSGTGQTTHLGQLTYTFEVEVDLLTGVGVGAAEFTAANGDRLFTTLTGLGVPSEMPGFNHVVEEQTVVGGTGRFVCASGSFTLDRLINLTTGVSEGTVDGTIVLPTKKRKTN